MKQYDRRTFIAATAGTALVGLSGCAGLGDGTRIRSYEVYDNPILPEPSEGGSPMDMWGFLIKDETTLSKYFGQRGGDEFRTFLDNTDFDSGDILLYLMAYANQGCYEIELNGKPHIADDGVPVVEATINRTQAIDQPCTDVIAQLDLLIRLSIKTSDEAIDAVRANVGGETKDIRSITVDSE